MTTLTLIRGWPGSGKSTLAKKLARTTNDLHLEADMYFIDANGNYNWTADKIAEAHRWCQQQTRRHLETRTNVFVSNTFTTHKELKPYFDIALDFDITPVIITMQNNFVNVHNVPVEAIDRMKNRFQYDVRELFEKHQQNMSVKFWHTKVI